MMGPRTFRLLSSPLAAVPRRVGSVWIALILAGAAAGAQPTFSVPQRDLPSPLVMIAYGDMRFTALSETGASSPSAREALVARVAAERPAALFLNGDIPWHGKPEDYAVFRDETRSWREAELRVYPALGNHEFSGCDEAQCLDLWWQAFPALRSHRWYSVALGERVFAIALDSDTSLLPGSDQRAWLEQQIRELSASVRFVIIFLHHPPLADVQGGDLASHNPRPNEISLADFLGTVAPGSKARFLVCAGHTHNYERFLRDGIVYLVSGGGGAAPYPVLRGASDLYQSGEFPNYHYVRLEMSASRVTGQMFRLHDYATLQPSSWELKDRFEISLRP